MDHLLILGRRHLEYTLKQSAMNRLPPVGPSFSIGGRALGLASAACPRTGAGPRADFPDPNRRALHGATAVPCFASGEL